MNAWNFERIVCLLKEAGGVALSHYDSPAWSLKDDRSIVTEADKAIESLFAAEFDRPSEGSLMIGEETSDLKSEQYVRDALAGTAWIVDPIDGTAPYSHHVPTWGISIGFAERGILKEGAIFLPATGEMFVTDGPNVLYACCPRERDAWNFSHFTALPVRKRELNDGGMISITQGMAKRGKIRVHNPVHALCCAVMPLPYLCMGRYLAYIGTLKVWDYAGGFPIIQKCGFTARFLNGEKMTGRIIDDCHAQAGGHARWRARDHIIFAPSEEVADYVAAHSSEE